MSESSEIRLLLCGDVMLGRGIDQVLPHPGDPTLYEHWRKVRDAGIFVALAQLRNGGIPAERGSDYVWGDALADFAALRPDLRLINLETAVTAGGAPWPRKPIHYRMHPRNVGVLACAGIDFCALANNHTLDWGYESLAETIDTLDRAGIRHAGAGRDRQQAAAPAILEIPGKGRVIVISAATASSGCPPAWGAGPDKPGLNQISLTDEWFDQLKGRLAEARRPGDIVVLSIHWGDNFGYVFKQSQRDFAYRLIDEAGVNLIHGHSSHHVHGIEVHSGSPILYGCGDLVNDYEGSFKMPGRLAFEPDLGLVYLARFSAADGRLAGLEMRPTRMRRLQVRRAGTDGARRLAGILNRYGQTLGTRVEQDGDGALHLRWELAEAAGRGLA